MIALHHSNVQPQGDNPHLNWEVLNALGFTEDDVNNAPPLQEVLQQVCRIIPQCYFQIFMFYNFKKVFKILIYSILQFDAYITNQRPSKLVFATDGPHPIRQVRRYTIKFFYLHF